MLKDQGLLKKLIGAKLTSREEEYLTSKCQGNLKGFAPRWVYFPRY